VAHLRKLEGSTSYAAHFNSSTSSAAHLKCSTSSAAHLEASKNFLNAFEVFYSNEFERLHISVLQLMTYMNDSSNWKD
jgi:hypothetical protein